VQGYARATTVHERRDDMQRLAATVPWLKPPRELPDPDPVVSLPLQVVFGLGTGRCGTLSLWKLLAAQVDCPTHTPHVSTQLRGTPPTLALVVPTCISSPPGHTTH
jgi:hypothetical protein